MTMHMSVRKRRPLRGLIVLCVAGTIFACCLSGLTFSLPVQLPDTNVLDRLITAPYAGPFEPLKSVSSSGDVLTSSSSVPATALSGQYVQPIENTFSLAFKSAGAATALTAVALQAAATAGGHDEAVKTSMSDKLSLLVSIGIWYFLNVSFNIYSKKTLLDFPFPWAVALVQMAFGIFLVGPLWATGIRKAPKLTFSEVMTLFPSALGHCVTHAGTAVSFAAGAVSFTQIVKATEPVTSATLNFLFAGQVLAWQSYASLIPIVGGVSLASFSGMGFTWLSLGAALAATTASALRAVYSKKVMAKETGENMTPANFYAIMVMLATLILIPAACVMEGPAAIVEGFKVAYAKGGTQFLLNWFYSGFFYYVYNEFAFKALTKMDPVSHAVCNTLKRVATIVATVLVFHTPVTTLGIVGSSVAILGTLAYSLSKTMFKA